MNAMNALSRDTVQARLHQLPSLPSVVSEMLASFSREDLNVQHLVHQLARDQALTARVLRVANSSFYGMQSRIGSIQNAVTVLGFRAVRSLVLSVGINSVFKPEQCPGFNLTAYFRHGVAVALLARALAGKSGHNPEVAFTAGLLHDIGQLVLAANFAKDFSDVLAYGKRHDCFGVVAERDVLGLDHAEVGSLLAEAWKFPDVLREAVADHHAPAATVATSLANLVHVADVVAHALNTGGSPDEMVLPLDRVAWTRLGLDWSDLAALLPAIEKDFEATCQAIIG